MSACRICGRRLRNPVHGAGEGASVLSASPPGARVVWIRDRGTGVTVTNDADAVVRELLARFPGARIIYRDTIGRWDELKHDGVRFTGFAPAPDMEFDGMRGT